MRWMRSQLYAFVAVERARGMDHECLTRISGAARAKALFGDCLSTPGVGLIAQHRQATQLSFEVAM